MATFGRFETAGELARSALAEIHVARRAGETGPARFVVKHQRPGGGLDEAPQAASDRFEESAQTQRAMVGSRYWAPIHDVGQADGVAYYVTDRYELHAGQLIHGWVHLRESALLSLVRSVAHGLIDLEKSQGRPHGNLKPTNVLLSRAGRSDRMRAALADPLAASRLREERDVKKDVRTIGELIYGLVTHREYAGDTAWPIERDASWAALGGAARTWCDLCNALLAPVEAGTERMTLAELVETLDQMARRRRRRRLPLLGAGAALALAAMAMGARLALHTGPCNVTSAEARRELAALWSAVGRDGFARDLDARLGDRPDAVPCLVELAEMSAQLGVIRGSYRQMIAGLDELRGGETLEYFYLDHLGSAAQATLTDEQACGIHRAWVAMERIRDVLARWSPGTEADWSAGVTPLLARFDDLVAARRPAETPAQWKAGLGGTQQRFAAPGLDETCRQGLAEVAALSADDALGADLCLFLLRREQAHCIESVLHAVDEQAAKRVGAARIPGGLAAGTAREAIRRWLAADVAAVAAGLDRHGVLGAADAQTLADAWRELENSTADPRRWKLLEERLRGVEQMLADLVLARTETAAGRGLDEEIPRLAGQEVRTVRQLYARWAQTPQLREIRTLLDAMDSEAASLRGFLNNPRLRE